MKMQKSYTFTIHSIMLIMIICVVFFTAAIRVDAEDSASKFNFEGKRFEGTCGACGERCTMEFYSTENDEGNVKHVKINDGGDISILPVLCYSDTGEFEIYTSNISGAWNGYIIQLSGIWENNSLTFRVELENGMTICWGTLDLTNPDPTPDPTPDENEKAILDIDETYAVVGESAYVTGVYTPKNPSRIVEELNAIQWSFDNDSLGEVGNFNYTISESNLSATFYLEILGKTFGETKIIGEIDGTLGESASADVVFEPKLILPKSNNSYGNNYDCNIVINGNDYISVKVQLMTDDSKYLESFLKSIEVKIDRTPNSSLGAIADISDRGYISYDDNMSGEYIINIDTNTNKIDNVITISTRAQTKEIRLICEDPLMDSDYDGIPDEWEKNGLDIDRDGRIDLDLKSMGAVVGHKDIFVEVDMMEGLPNISQESFDIVAKQFKDHGFYLHIDAGSESVDYVTGKKWGDLSQSNLMPFEEITQLYEEIDVTNKTMYNFNKWNILTEDNFLHNRRSVFRHCMFINFFDNKGTSGIARGIPEQSFVITVGGFNRGSDDEPVRAMAGTFMHELGHTLGLKHGGVDSIKNKPNHLSVMNYLYQFSGLYGTNEINYSEYVLPTLDENSINEYEGIDPEGIIDNPRIGTKWLLTNDDKKSGHSCEATGVKRIDFNGDNKLDSSIKLDFWHGGNDIENGIINEPENGINLASINEWEALKLKAGSIGDLGASSPTTKIVTDPNKVEIEEISVQEAIELGVYENIYEGCKTHKLVKISRQEPTCTEDGNIDYFRCEVCGNIFEDQSGKIELSTEDVTISALGHEWDEEYTIDKNPTCDQTGSKSIHCKNCSATRSKLNIPPVGHKWNNGEIIHKPTTENAGKKIYKCIICGQIKEDSIPALVEVTTNVPDSNDSNQQKVATNEAKEKNTAAKTGDNLSVWFWVALLILSSIVGIKYFFITKCYYKQDEM